ncbi:MAG: hypothetical protein AAFR83_06240 [Cyanobacteria bacterium J06629_18]
MITLIGFGLLATIINGGSSDVDTTISTSDENEVASIEKGESTSESSEPKKTKYQLAQELKSEAESIQLPESSSIPSMDTDHKITLGTYR